MTATRTLPSPVQSPPGRSWSALAVLMIGTFMFVLDFFIVNVALPAIQQGLRAGEGAIEWIVAGYAISTAVLLVTGGRLGDQFGRRRVFAIGMTVFVLTSAACALAPDPAVLVDGPDTAGRRRRADGSQHLVDPGRGLQRPGPGAGDQRVRDGDGPGRRLRAAHRRRPHPRRPGRDGLAGDLLDQRAARRGRAAGLPRAWCPSRAPTSAPASTWPGSP